MGPFTGRRLKETGKKTSPAGLNIVCVKFYSQGQMSGKK